MENNSRGISGILNNADSFIIYSEPKVGKSTFALYIIKMLYQEQAVVFSSQDSYVFDKKIKALAKQFTQFENINNHLTHYYLSKEWKLSKRLYGYGLLLQEIDTLLSQSDEKIILFHKLEDFFEFQDRYEIESFYKSLIKLSREHNKKIIFIINNQSQNYRYIQSIAEEYSDLAIQLSKNEHNDRVVEIKNLVNNEEYPLVNFSQKDSYFLLKYQELDSDKNRVRNVLLMDLNEEKDEMHQHMIDIFQYIFNRPNFSITYADSLQSSLQHIFIEPDLIIIVMNRNEENFATIKAIKKHLKKTKIITIIQQDFVRTEDIQEAYMNGSDELFPRNFLFNDVILSLQKSLDSSFYSDSLKTINIPQSQLNSFTVLKEFALECTNKGIFFTLFAVRMKAENVEFIQSSMRRFDFICQVDNVVYYLALNTMSSNVDIILKKQEEKYDKSLDLIFKCTPFNQSMVEGCLSC